jgi:putative SOS response-associated peptidase YedK
MNASAKTRRDGWTAERQLRFLDALARTRCVIKAAEFAGMSREGAYRLRERKDGALFAALWERAVERPAGKVHTPALTDGGIMRLLGTRYRRERGDFSSIGSIAVEAPPA